jgi:hypothetical protein
LYRLRQSLRGRRHLQNRNSALRPSPHSAFPKRLSFAGARDSLHLNSEYHSLRRCRRARDRIDRRQVWESSEQGSQGFISLRRFNNLLVRTKSESTLPVEIVHYPVDLKTSPRVAPQQINLSARQRVDVNAFAVKDLAHRHDVSFPVRHAAEPANLARGKQSPGFIST